jgi:hypothetical protein
MEIMPATLKIIEKARKYHFLPSQSTLTLRKNSTDSLPFLGAGTRTGSGILMFSAASRAAATPKN